MNKVIAFKLEERQPNQFYIVPNFEVLPIETTNGSFNILPARLLGLSYANYLRMCRDECEGTIVGKGKPYPTVWFHRNGEVSQLINLLNARATLALFDKSFESKKEELQKLREKVLSKNVEKESADES